MWDLIDARAGYRRRELVEVDDATYKTGRSDLSRRDVKQNSQRAREAHSKV